MTASNPLDSDLPWFFSRIEEWKDEGWNCKGIEEFLSSDVASASERLLSVEFKVNGARELLSRIEFMPLANSEAEAKRDVWLKVLNNPMTYESTLSEYETWAQDNRPWEPVLNSVADAWDSVGLNEARKELLARFDSLDPSSIPATSAIIPMLRDAREHVALQGFLATIEADEDRQKSMISKAISTLSEQGFLVSHLQHMSLGEGLDEVDKWLSLASEFEDLRLLIVREIKPFDADLANHHDSRRQLLMKDGLEADIKNLYIQIEAIADNLHERKSHIDSLLNGWRAKGIILPHDDDIRNEELLEWETNLPEIEANVNLHLRALDKWKNFQALWPDRVGESQHLAGKLDSTELFIEAVETLEQDWHSYELEAVSAVEKYSNLGLVMDEWPQRIADEPRTAAKWLKSIAPRLDKRIDLIKLLEQLDTSFEGREEVDNRIGILRELEIEDDIIADIEAFCDKTARRGARHRRMLETDWRELLALGKGSPDLQTNLLSLADFENAISDARKFGKSTNLSNTSSAIVSGDVSSRIKSRLSQELNWLSDAGWQVQHLVEDMEEDLVRIAKTVNNFRELVDGHEKIRRRLAPLPWNRDVSLALDVQNRLSRPDELSALVEEIPALIRHLASKEVEDEDFVFTAWKPSAARATLVPQAANHKILEPSSAYEDAHEAILESMEAEIVDDGEITVDSIEIQAPSEPIVEVKQSQEQPAKMVEKKMPTVVVTNEKLEAVKEVEEAKPEPLLQPVKPAPAPQLEAEPAVELEAVSEEDEQPIQEVESASEDDLEFALNGLREFLRALDLHDLAKGLEDLQDLPEIRRELASHVGIEPRDLRVDRILRLSLRLLPRGEAGDKQRGALLSILADSVTSMKKWIRRRLEARHSASQDDFLLDSENLGIALERIPGPALSIPLFKDEVDLPNAMDSSGLETSVMRVQAACKLPNAGGIA